MEKFFYIFLFAFPIAGLILYTIFNRSRELTGPAVAVSRRIVYGRTPSRGSRNWNYLITFRFGDDDTLELCATQEEYATIPEGQQGQLTWDGETLIRFESDIL